MSSIQAPLARISAIVERLRDPVSGCDWDRVQTFATIAPYTIEEAYEVADAIARNDAAAIKEELGDLLFQVILHARIAEQAGHFSLDDVATAIADKMERRHPHIFGNAATRPDWESMKAAERDGTSALDGVAIALPALMRAEKLQKRAARTGFDWPDAEQFQGRYSDVVRGLPQRIAGRRLHPPARRPYQRLQFRQVPR